MSVRIIREELKGMGIIDSNDTMIWKSPDNSYIFEITRTDLDNINPLFPRYMISITIKNIIGIKILELRFSELDAVRILDNIEVFCGGEEYYNTGESFIIPINPTDTSLNSYDIYLENLFDWEDITVNGEERTIYKDIIFKIKQYNPIEGTLIDRISMTLSYEDINDLAFKLFFETLIDVDFPKELDPTMNRIDDYISLGPNALRMMDYHINPVNTNTPVILEDIDKSSMYEVPMIKTNITPKPITSKLNTGRVSFLEHNNKLK